MVKYMKQRVISALIAIAIIIPIIILGGITYYIGVGIISIIAYHEIISVREKEKKIHPLVKILALLSYLVIVLSGTMSGTNFNIDYRLFIMDLFVCLLPLVIFYKKDYDAEDALVLVAITLFLGIGFKFLIIDINNNKKFKCIIFSICITCNYYI